MYLPSSIERIHHRINSGFLRAVYPRYENYWEGYKINKPFFGLLVCRLIMPLAKTLSSKSYIFPRSFAFRPISDNLSAADISRHTNRLKGFIRPLFPSRSLLSRYAQITGADCFLCSSDHLNQKPRSSLLDVTFQSK